MNLLLINRPVRRTRRPGIRQGPPITVTPPLAVAR